MKILRRLSRVIIFIITIPLAVLEVPYYGIRWILTGKEFPPNGPICVEFLLGEEK